MGANTNYYDILGVDKQATAEGKYTSYALCINITTVHTTNTTVLTYNNTQYRRTTQGIQKAGSKVASR